MKYFKSGYRAGLFGLWAFGAALIAHGAGPETRGWDFSALGEIPVQHGGRIKPLDTLGREVALKITSSRTIPGFSPAEFLVSLLAEPEAWSAKVFFRVAHIDVKKQLLLPIERLTFSRQELLANSTVAQYASTFGRKSTTAIESITTSTSLQPAREKEFQSLMEALLNFSQVASGELFAVLPPSHQIQGEDEALKWKSLYELRSEPAVPGSMSEAWKDLFISYLERDRVKFDASVDRVRSRVSATTLEQFHSSPAVLHAEALYNRTHPFGIAWVLYLVAALSFVAALVEVKGMRVVGWTTIAAGLAVHTFGFGLRCWIAGRPPVSNMYESIVWVAMGVLFFALMIYRQQPKAQRNLVLPIVGATLAGFALIAADAAPAVMDPGIHPLVPVLRSNAWLTIHVLTITISYAAFALAMGISNVALFQHLRAARGVKGMVASIDRLNHLTYRATQFGVVLLAAGTILGGVWADYSWGRFWGWDPKEVWALIALLCYLALLHSRYTGWVGTLGFPAWTVGCFMSVMMAWYGVNFILGVGLHSYGFTSGGSGAVWLGIAVQLLYVGAVVLFAKIRAKAKA